MYYTTADQMAQLDSLAVENGLEIRQMMELAGWHMLSIFEKKKIRKDQRIVIVVGKGNKGGDGLCAARHLANHRYRNLTVVLAEEGLKSDPAHHLLLLERMGISTIAYAKQKDEADQKIKSAEVIIDALLGYRLNGAPRDAYHDIITSTNESKAIVISYDMPSGVDATTGESFSPHISADVTLTLAIPKKVFQSDSGKNASGNVYVGDIGIPSFLYDKIHDGIYPEFDATGIVEL